LTCVTDFRHFAISNKKFFVASVSWIQTPGTDAFFLPAGRDASPHQRLRQWPRVCVTTSPQRSANPRSHGLSPRFQVGLSVSGRPQSSADCRRGPDRKRRRRPHRPLSSGEGGSLLADRLTDWRPVNQGGPQRLGPVPPDAAQCRASVCNRRRATRLGVRVQNGNQRLTSAAFRDEGRLCCRRRSWFASSRRSAFPLSGRPRGTTAV